MSEKTAIQILAENPPPKNGVFFNVGKCIGHCKNLAREIGIPLPMPKRGDALSLMYWNNVYSDLVAIKANMNGEPAPTPAAHTTVSTTPAPVTRAEIPALVVAAALPAGAAPIKVEPAPQIDVSKMSLDAQIAARKSSPLKPTAEIASLESKIASTPDGLTKDCMVARLNTLKSQ